MIGTMVSVFAMVMATNDLRFTGAPYPWECIIDQKPSTPLLVTATDIPTTIQLCQGAELPDGPHLLNFTFTTPTGSGNISSLFLDYIEYLPSASSKPRTFEFTSISFDDMDIIFTEEGSGGGFLSKGWTAIPGLNDGTTGLMVNVLQPNTSAGIGIPFHGS